MKARYNTVDIVVIVQELKRFLGMRVVNVYDIDNKTYLIRVGKPDEKCIIFIESGIRLHNTDFDWPKNPAPSGFSMKLRKHLKGRRFENIRQLGIDRIVDLQFGSGEAAYHVILELYDRGNIVLTDYEYLILNILRPRTDNSQDVRFAVKETYPVDGSKTHTAPSEQSIRELMQGGKDGDVLKKFLVPNLDYGPAIIEHALLFAGFSENVKFGSGFNMETDFTKLMSGIMEAESLLNTFMTQPCKGYIIQKKDKKSNAVAGGVEEVVLYEEFHPFLFKQHSGKSFVEFEFFNKAVDEFFSKQESQKLDLKVIQHEKSAYKKLDNVKRDHEKRLHGLKKEQESDTLRGQLIEMNLDMVDKAILIVRSAVANQIDWKEIWSLVKEAQVNGDPVACAIKSLKLDTNQITILLHDPYVGSDDDEESEYETIKPMRVDLDLTLSAYGNSRKYFDKKKLAAKKEQKTVEASNKAFKSAEKKTKQSLKEVQTAVSINKTRKTYWFEKFLWFVSSENYLVIGGRDQQQNEMIVKRYMKAGDLYVHADLHGASSCLLKNPGGRPVPPKTLNEAGTMAICNSAAWDSKVVTSAWWVYHDQVSKTAPSGEYLTTGSFMIRGRKNYLPPSYLIYGFGFLFKLEDSSVERHQGERRVRLADEDDAMSVTSYSVAESEDIEMSIGDDNDSSDDEGDNDDREPGDKDENQSSQPEQVLQNNPGDNDEETNTEIGPNSDDLEKSKHDDVESISSKTKDLSIKNAAQNSVKAAPGVDFDFPDTNISLQHVKGDKYELQREVSRDSNPESDVIYFGDSVPVTLGEKATNKSSRLSAKQRREMKKKKNMPMGGEEEEEEEEVKVFQPSKIKEVPITKADDSEDEDDKKPVAASTVTAPKRGQKSKKKKIKEKYAYQDEEERSLRMEILASAGEPKNKNKKGKDAPQGKQKQPAQGPRPKSGQGKGHGHVQAPASLAEGKGSKDEPMLLLHAEGGETTTASEQQSTEEKFRTEKKPPVKQDPESDGEKEEDNASADDTAILNSLTGIPVSEDELLYAIPVCAPYNALLNYKYKVKLMPGNTKKGKAMKTALGVFVHDKSASNREKDLLKIQKDVDLARNVPGKVKVAAPNMHKGKR